MARSSQVAVENNFTRGLITEATAMTFPENAVTDIDNCVISSRGVVTRRLGLDYENNYAIIANSTITSNVGAFNEFEWTAVANNGSTSFLVQQVANRIVFFLIDATTGITANKKSFEIDLLLWKVSGWTDAQVYETPVSFASGAGFLYITSPYCESLLVEYDVAADNIIVDFISIVVRDMFGVDDGLEIDERPTSITNAHKYNLYNQGWGTFTNCDPAPAKIAFDHWDLNRSDFPSNADIFWLYRDSLERFSIPDIDEVYLGTTEAPRGHYLFGAFNLNRTVVFPGVETEITNSRPSTVAFYTGRTFYSGVKDKRYSNRVYFSQIIGDRISVGKCYQKNDPTSEINFDILPDDGGVIVIAEAGEIRQVVNSGNSLLVFASNGTWAISGSDNNPFSPTNYSVTRISEIGTAGILPTVIVEGTPVWITNEGIYTIQVSEISRLPNAISITKDTIQTFFETIPKDNLPYIKGVYNSVEKVVIWLYRSTAATTVSEYYKYDKMLVLDRVSNAFYKHSISTSLAPNISGVVAVDGLDLNGKKTVVFKFLTTGNIGTAGAAAFTYSQMTNTDFTDWVTFNSVGVVAPSYFITGYRVRGELLKKFQSNYLMVLTGDADDGSCLVQGIWDYSNTTGNGRFTSSQEVYRPDSTYNYHRAKLKIRGNGYSLQFKFRSNGNAPFKLIGWSTFETANNVP